MFLLWTCRCCIKTYSNLSIDTDTFSTIHPIRERLCNMYGSLKIIMYCWIYCTSSFKFLIICNCVWDVICNYTFQQHWFQGICAIILTLPLSNIVFPSSTHCFYFEFKLYIWGAKRLQIWLATCCVRLYYLSCSSGQACNGFMCGSSF